MGVTDEQTPILLANAVLSYAVYCAAKNKLQLYSKLSALIYVMTTWL